MDDFQGRVPPNRSLFTNGVWRSTPDSWIGSSSAPDDLDTRPIQQGLLFQYDYNRSVALYRCPADRSKVINSSRLRTRSYSMNGNLGGRTNEVQNTVTRADAIPNPAKLLVFIDEAEDSIDDAHFLVWPAPDTRWVNLPAGRHAQNGILSFADGHAEMLKPVLKIPKASNYGRPRADARAVFDAILFLLHTGCQWKFLPRTFPPKSTVHDCLKLWSQSHAFRKLLARVIRQLLQTGRINLDECFIDATFAAAKGGGQEVGLTRKGKGTKLQVIADAQGIPPGISTAPASAGEPPMVQGTLAFMEPETQPGKLVGDKGCDCDALDDALAEMGVEMIAPHRSNRRPDTVTQDGLPLRRYRRRWIVERTIAWLGSHRRLLTRWEKHASHVASFAIPGCLMIALRHLPC